MDTTATCLASWQLAESAIAYILCAAVMVPLKTMDTAAHRLASWQLAESAIAYILCAAVMVPLEIVDATRRRGDNDWPVPSVS
jgi:Na+/melibiose symporter-like transporter